MALLPLQVLTDSHGSVTLGFIRDGVLYARLAGALSAELGTAHARCFESLVSGIPRLRYYADASRVTSYDLLARSALVRVLLAHRRRFTSVVVLTWAEGTSSVTRTLAETFGENMHVSTERAEFDSMLRHVAPEANGMLHQRARTGTLV